MPIRLVEVGYLVNRVIYYRPDEREPALRHAGRMDATYPVRPKHRFETLYIMENEDEPLHETRLGQSRNDNSVCPEPSARAEPSKPGREDQKRAGTSPGVD